MRRLGVAVASAALAVTPAPARADAWESARDPHAHRARRTAEAVERLAIAAARARRWRFESGFQRAAVAVVELARREGVRSAELDALMAELLLGWPDAIPDDRPRRFAEARALLEASLPRLPVARQASAWFLLAIACARLGDPRCERRAYDRALEVEWRTDARANILLNRAETSLVLGDVDASVRGYRAALGLAQTPVHLALAWYGLAIALERRGDLAAALPAVRAAAAVRMPASGGRALDEPSVFFVPAYDRHYYEALEALGLAGDATSPAERRALLELAREHLDAWLEAARPERSRWLRNAERLRAHLEAALARESPGAARPGDGAARR
ncbi:MAG: hypothetical protein IT376_05485 [Polyangiaceae bacterium]|nr:hypothetical protein [Polyangiaceae bacterium]